MAEHLLLKRLDGVDQGLDDAPDELNTAKAPGEDELDAVALVDRLASAFHYRLQIPVLLRLRRPPRRHVRCKNNIGRQVLYA